MTPVEFDMLADAIVENGSYKRSYAYERWVWIIGCLVLIYEEPRYWDSDDVDMPQYIEARDLLKGKRVFEREM